MGIFSPFWRIFSNFGTVIFSAAVDCDIMLLLPPLHHMIQFFLQGFIVLWILHKIKPGGIYHQKGGFRIFKKELTVGLRHSFHIVPLQPLLEGPLSLLDAVHENIGTGLKKDDKIGFGEAAIQQLIDTIIQIRFILRQIEGGKYLIFGKNIVANGYLVEQVLLLELYLLAIARKKEKNLRLKGIAAG